ncbi:MAG: hypothetical protein IPJ17_03025 [Holophagales bacterium]|nr:MAG: hypothetical protein IPJ17_03025 [Holophagales bacterium]
MSNRRMPLALSLITLFAFVGGAGSARAAAPDLWEDLPSAVSTAAGEREAQPRAARVVRLDRAALTALLAAAPAEMDAPRGLAELELPIPDPDGGILRFRVVDSPVMAPELAARYPEIRTFRLIGAGGDALTGRADWTPHGFHAMVRTARGTFFVDPLERGDLEDYRVYRKADLVRPTGETWTCGVRGDEDASPLVASPASPEAAGPNLRTYRLALASTGEYSVAVCGAGPTKPCVLAEMVTAMNRVNQVYEDEVAIRMILVANNDLVIYLDGTSDPYTNNNGSTMLVQNANNLNTVLGNANFDIGHVFSTGGGGIATLRGPCGSNKARGVTGLPSPLGDPFYIDYVAHEMGHQWGGNHTFNGNTSNCGGGNRNATTAYEPGSGSTIMAYAGICGASSDLQPHSDAYFHAVSLDEIVSFSRTSSGNTCAVPITAVNELPTANAGADYTIPYGTPFALTGSGTDTNGDPLTYDWEEWDLGAAGVPASPVGDAPILRSFEPTSSPTRIFPKVSDLVNNTSTIGELLPFSGRPQLDFRLTVRDNANPAGAFASDFMAITIAASGPFLVTDPNTAITWSGVGPHNVGWNVAGTDTAPVNCSAVDILLSTDGGLTFPWTLATATPNDGNATVNVTVPDTTTARIKVACNGNIFFDLSNANFTIVDAVLFSDGFESGTLAGWVL